MAPKVTSNEIKLRHISALAAKIGWHDWMMGTLVDTKLPKEELENEITGRDDGTAERSAADVRGPHGTKLERCEAFTEPASVRASVPLTCIREHVVGMSEDRVDYREDELDKLKEKESEGKKAVECGGDASLSPLASSVEKELSAYWTPTNIYSGLGVSGEDLTIRAVADRSPRRRMSKIRKKFEATETVGKSKALEVGARSCASTGKTGSLINWDSLMSAGESSDDDGHGVKSTKIQIDVLPPTLHVDAHKNAKIEWNEEMLGRPGVQRAKSLLVRTVY
jgi:hypothetical protein